MGTLVVNGIGASASKRPARSRFADTEALSDNHSALVPATLPVKDIDANGHAAPFSRRPAAPFLAHLIATSRGEPQTRNHRRAAPDVAVQAYAAASAQLRGLAVRKN